MTTRRGSPRSFGPARTRARLTWRAFNVRGISPAAGAKSVQALDVVGPAPFLSTAGVVGDYTIRRIRGMLEFLNEGATTGGSADVYWGVVVVSRDAFDAVPPVTLDPEDDNADWMLYGTGYAPRIGNGLVISTHERIRVGFESKAMRKVNENNSRVAFVFKIGLTQGETVTFSLSGRMLVSHGRQ